MGFEICAIGISYKTPFAEPVTFTTLTDNDY